MVSISLLAGRQGLRSSGTIESSPLPTPGKYGSCIVGTI